MKRLFVSKALSFVSLLALGIAFATSAAPAAAATVIYVDDDGRQCATPYHTIADGVAAASALPDWSLPTPKKVIICRGLYPESTVHVLFAQNLKITARPGVTVTPGIVPFLGFMFNIVDSTDVSITGFVIDGLDSLGGPTPISGSPMAIAYFNTSGLIAKNKIVNWTHGATPSVNAFGIYVSSYSAGPVRIDQNTISRFNATAIMASGDDLTITRNNITATSLFVNPIIGISVGGDRAVVTGNKITSDAYPVVGFGSRAIWLFAGKNAKINSNIISHFDTGIELTSTCDPATSSYNQVAQNKIVDAFTGIFVNADGGYCTGTAHADKNEITGNAIRIDGKLLGNFGVRVVAGPASATAAGNLIIGNTIKHYTPGQEVYLDPASGGSYSGTVTAPNHIIP